MQVYRELRVLTARPDDHDLARAASAVWLSSRQRPLFGGPWRTRALAEIAAAGAAGQVPILCGGTGLYFKALIEGLAPIPEIAPALRARLRARLADIGGAAFRRELAARDPLGAARLYDGDSQRLIRAMKSSRALADTRRLAQQAAPAVPLTCLTFVMAPPRPALRPCDARFEAMLTAGAVAEAPAQGPWPLSGPARHESGWRCQLDYIDEKCDLDIAVAGAQQKHGVTPNASHLVQAPNRTISPPATIFGKISRRNLSKNSGVSVDRGCLSHWFPASHAAGWSARLWL